MNRTISIFTNNNYKKNLIFDIVYDLSQNNIIKFKNCKNETVIELKTGERYIWIRPIDSSRGYRINKAYIDNQISPEILDNIVFPICNCEGNEMIFF